MKINPTIYVHERGVSFEIIAETTTETALLEDLWEHGELSQGNGQSPARRPGGKQGFYIRQKKDQPHA